MRNFSRDELRVVVCFAGIAGLFFQLLAQTVLGAEVGQGLTGAFVTLATLPLADAALEKFSSKRGPTDPPDSPPPAPPESTSEGIKRRSDIQHQERSDFESLMVAA